jgi:phytoene synthase
MPLVCRPGLENNLDQNLSQAAEQVRRWDRERFVTALFAPPERRDALMVLYAFNAEAARVRENVREPLAGRIRLQWWREVIAGARPEGETIGHPVAAPLIALIAEGLPAAPLDAILEGRERDLDGEPFAGPDDLESYAEATSGRLSQAAALLLGGADAETQAAAGAVGTAFALAGLMRATPHWASTGRLTLAEAAGGGAAMAAAAAVIGARARALLAEARRRPIERRALAALLPGTLATVHLKRMERAGWDVFASHLARPATAPVRLMVNWARGRF